MYIEQVIAICDSLYPNPYSKHEKLHWCNELSKVLFLRYNMQRTTSELSGSDGIFALPENVYASYVEEIIFNNTSFKKHEFAKNGIMISNHDRGCTVTLPKNAEFQRVYAVHLTPYDDIRSYTFADSITVSENVFFTKSKIIRKGDTLKITVDGTEYDDIFVFNCTPVQDGYNVSFSGNSLPEGTNTSEITRKITEQTICPPPYDSMYTDYLLGKICYYQNDFDSCNRHMALYNSKLSDYEGWLKSHPITSSENKKLVNWW